MLDWDIFLTVTGVVTENHFGRRFAQNKFEFR